VDRNNQESSSEAINAYASMLFWAEYTGNTAMRDAAAYLYITEVRAIQEYWFDVDDTNHPSAWPYDTAAMVWGNGYKYETYFTADIGRSTASTSSPVSAHMGSWAGTAGCVGQLQRTRHQRFRRRRL